MNRPSARYNRDKMVIEVSREHLDGDRWKNSPEYHYYCWREVTQAMMMGKTAEEIQSEAPDMWESALKHVGKTK
jgi:hypothetical protein